MRPEYYETDRAFYFFETERGRTHLSILSIIGVTVDDIDDVITLFTEYHIFNFHKTEHNELELTAMLKKLNK